jgi:hypothetical protein
MVARKHAQNDTISPRHFRRGEAFMGYLYGDSTPSTLEVDYIELLRDAVDCCVQVLLADERIANGKARLEALEKSTTAELDQVRQAAALVPKAFEGAPLGAPESPAARCAAAIVRSAAALAAATVDDVQGKFDAAVGDRASEADRERQACADALERLLVKHDLPEMKSEMQITFVGAGHYVGRAHVSTGFGVSGTLELGIPKDHLFERIVRVDRLAERLDVLAPEIGGWLHKEIKLRPQHLEKHYVAGLSVGAAGDSLRLRSTPDGGGSGFDVTFGPAGGPVRLMRVEEANKREDEPFEVEAADVPKLQSLRERLLAAANSLARHRRGLTDAKLDGEPLRSHPSPSLLAERLVLALAPTVQEIASRSQTPGELVLRRLIGDARREEIFLSKQELKTKLEPLSDRNRSLFDPLWFVPPAGAAPAKIAVGIPALPAVAPIAAPPQPAAGAAPLPPSTDLRPGDEIDLLDSSTVTVISEDYASGPTSDTRSEADTEISLVEQLTS